jgi:hypothetical protein
MAARPLTKAHRAASIANYQARIAEAEAKLGGPETTARPHQIDLWRGYLAKLESTMA